MAKTKTLENFLEELFQKAPKEKNTIKIIKYNGMSKPITYKCLKCNTIETISSATNLMRRHTGIICKVCNDPNKERKQQKALEDKVYKMMKDSPNLVLVKLFQKQRGSRNRLAIRYKCMLCGKESEVYAQDVKNNYFSCQHCGIGARQSSDDFAQWFSNTYPDLELVNSNEYQKYDSRVHVRCKKCNFIFFPSAVNLKRKNRVICPKCKNGKSKSEIYISDWLTKNHIDFETEVCFPWLPNCRYDFYIPSKKLIIEYDGEQHNCYTPHFHKKYEDFLKYQENDKIKNLKAINNNFHIVRISYKYKNNLNTILTEIFGSTTISKESRGKCFEIDNLLLKEKDIV